jgi:hypothetical protein
MLNEKIGLGLLTQIVIFYFGIKVNIIGISVLFNRLHNFFF